MSDKQLQDDFTRQRLIIEYLEQIDPGARRFSYYDVNSFYDAKKIKPAIKKLLAGRRGKPADTKEMLTALQSHNKELLEYYKAIMANERLQLKKEIIKHPGTDKTRELATKYTKATGQRQVRSGSPGSLRQLLNELQDDATEYKTITDYEITDANTLADELLKSERLTIVMYGLDISDTAEASDNAQDIINLRSEANKLADKIGLSDSQHRKDNYLWSIAFEGLLANILGQLITERPKSQPEPLELFSNTIMGLDAEKVTARHELFRSLDQGLRQLSTDKIHELYTSDKQQTITIPNQSSGIKSVYQINIKPVVTMGGYSMPVVSSKADAERLSARTIKAQLLLYAWTIRTGSYSVNNAKISDMLKNAGLEATRIQKEDYLDILKGLLNLEGAEFSIQADRYYDKQRKRTIKLGKNEVYGKTIKPLGSTEVIWHMAPKVYEYTDDEYNKLDDDTKAKLELKGIVKPNDDTKADEPKNKYYKIVSTQKLATKKGPDKEQKIYEQEPVYIKKIIYARVAEGMNNPNQRRAILYSKGLMSLNTAQQGHYILLGSEIANLYQQYQADIIKGEPIRLKIVTVLDYLGLSTAEHQRRSSDTRQRMIKALDTLKDKPVNHIGKWQLRGKLSLDDINIADSQDREQVILIWPPDDLIKNLKADNDKDDSDAAMLKILKAEVRNKGKTATAEFYKIGPETLDDIISNREAIAACLPPEAYEQLKDKADFSNK